ncbi:YdeI/OmpD-associated family protein [Dyella acidiphila]|uniref:YdeI/OmpD-associated family protein n=1 Tax=Dyella acidiphila TaxID=2775866 RepID=A0ABR9G7D7_9GAMM|nr:YdeI/OmpD-associated family protein [Dyella acidiphila]MBE1159962.1 YdeI/OmpD-associated family protein [Dyella acidiphila]
MKPAPHYDPKVDAYIAQAPAFARPILEHLRALVHATCPEAEEAIKWRCPHFSYNGRLMCAMAAFKQHCAFHFRHYREVVGRSAEEGMGQFGKLTSVKDLPGKRELAAYVHKAMALNETGHKPERPKAPRKPAPAVPADFAAQLQQHAAARQHYEGFSPSAQREYIDWINEAKTDTTRHKRIATALEWLAQGKHRNWKYMQ